MKFLLSAVLLFFYGMATATDTIQNKARCQLGVTMMAGYSFSGVALVPALEFIHQHHLFYLGPKFITNRNYLPNKGPWGLNAGYKHEFRNIPSKVLSFIFFTDYQLLSGKAFSQTVESKKRNYYHELFIGYGIQIRVAPNAYIGNAMGLGAHMEVFNNIDLNWKKTYIGFNNIFRLYASYRF